MKNIRMVISKEVVWLASNIFYILIQILRERVIIVMLIIIMQAIIIEMKLITMMMMTMRTFFEKCSPLMTIHKVII